ncbi:MAG: M61 family peptidase, partial [Acidobacteria bacterium]
ADTLRVAPELVVPEQWKLATALRPVRREAGRVAFAPVPLTTLVDSPVLAARYMREELLVGEPVPYTLHVAADSPAALAFEDEVVEAHRRLVREALALFGAPHHERYEFLVTLSDHVRSFGLEHHASSDNRLPERTWIAPDKLVRRAGLLPHELVHSWNGKYRRPAGMVAPDFQRPLDTRLLWVYEGLTSYLGAVLTARSGLRTPEQFREDLAATAAGMAHRAGRRWRPLADTAAAAQTLFGSPAAWQSWRRSVDFYPEGVLLWLEVDATIRERSGGRRSLDDFCRAFFGPPAGPAEVRGYTFDDLVDALAKVEPYDWRAFFTERVDVVRPAPPLEGLERAGWKLVYGPERNQFADGGRRAGGGALDLTDGLGAAIAKNGTIRDVVPGSPADRAGLAPGSRVLAVAGRTYTPDRMLDTLEGHGANDDGDSLTLQLVVEDKEFVRPVTVTLPRGPRFPHLERIDGRDDLLAAIVSPSVTRHSKRQAETVGMPPCTRHPHQRHFAGCITPKSLLLTPETPRDAKPVVIGLRSDTRMLTLYVKSVLAIGDTILVPVRDRVLPSTCRDSSHRAMPTQPDSATLTHGRTSRRVPNHNPVKRWIRVFCRLPSKRPELTARAVWRPLDLYASRNDLRRIALPGDGHDAR